MRGEFDHYEDLSHLGSDEFVDYCQSHRALREFLVTDPSAMPSFDDSITAVAIHIATLLYSVGVSHEDTGQPYATRWSLRGERFGKKIVAAYASTSGISTIDVYDLRAPATREHCLYTFSLPIFKGEEVERAREFRYVIKWQVPDRNLFPGEGVDAQVEFTKLLQPTVLHVLSLTPTPPLMKPQDIHFSRE